MNNYKDIKKQFAINKSRKYHYSKRIAGKQLTKTVICPNCKRKNKIFLSVKSNSYCLYCGENL